MSPVLLTRDDYIRGRVGQRENIHFTCKWHKNIFVIFSVMEYTHGAWLQIFLLPLLRKILFISIFLLARVAPYYRGSS